jgi:hypothetical protein
MGLLRGVRVSGSLLLLLSLHAIVMTMSVWWRYQEPVFTLLVSLQIDYVLFIRSSPVVSQTLVCYFRYFVSTVQF